MVDCRCRPSTLKASREGFLRLQPCECPMISALVFKKNRLPFSRDDRSPCDRVYRPLRKEPLAKRQGDRRAPVHSAAPALTRSAAVKPGFVFDASGMVWPAEEVFFPGSRVISPMGATIPIPSRTAGDHRKETRGGVTIASPCRKNLSPAPGRQANRHHTLLRRRPSSREGLCRTNTAFAPAHCDPREHCVFFFNAPKCARRSAI